MDSKKFNLLFFFQGMRVPIYEFLREDIFKKDADGQFALWKGVVCGEASYFFF